MELVAEFVLIPATVLFLLACLWSLGRNGKSKASEKFPPGNMGLPLIGETLSFVKPHSATRLGQFMEPRISRFGKVFSSNLFGARTIVSADAKLNRFVLKNDMKLFTVGWPHAFKQIVGGDSISFSVGDVHRHMRSTLLEFFSGERLRTVFLEDMNHFASHLVSSWKEGTTISAKGEAVKFSMCVMVKKILNMTPGAPEIENLKTEYGSFLRGMSSFPLNLPGTTYWKALQSRENILKLFMREIQKRNEKMDDKNSKVDEEDFLGWLMKNTNYSPKKIAVFLLNVLFGGHDTTSRAISSSIYLLHGCPSAIQQLREEHLQVVKSKKLEDRSKLTWDDYKNLEFTKCVINETLRLANISSLVLKKAAEDVEFNGYVIPRGCKIMLHYKAVNLDSSLYENPEQFNPWRWLSSSGTELAKNLTPFGGGVRMCPGAELARLEMAVFLHHLILNYDWELAEPHDHPLNVPFLEFPKGLPIKVQAASTKLGMT